MKVDFFQIYASAVAGSEGWSSAKLADALGIGRQYLSSLMNRKKSPTDEMYQKMLSIAKDVLPDEFFNTPSSDVSNLLSPKARAALKVIQELEGGDQVEALNRTIEQHGLSLLQGSSPKHQVKKSNEDQQS